MKTFKALLEELEQRIDVHNKYNQEKWNLDWIVMKIEKMVSGKDPDKFVKKVKIGPDLYATQAWLSNEGGGDPVFYDLEDYPVVAQIGREYLIMDGHHRVNRLLGRTNSFDAYVFKVK